MEERRAKAVQDGREMGLCFKWVPGSAIPGKRLWEKAHSEAVEVWVDLSLFADDTTVVGDEEELEEGVEEIKRVMSQFEERNNDDKEEKLIFGSEDSGEVRMLGCWMGWKKDVSQRLSRAGKAWAKVRGRLVGSKLPKKMQARVVEACVESALLFDCQVRVWRVREIRRMQSMVDRCYRYVWSRKTGPPLMQMQREKKNMEDVRRELGVKSLRWKVEKRVLERIGHVMRMDDERMTKAVVLGWLGELEKWPKPKGGRRKTVLYWKKLLREAGIDWTDLESVTKDRKVWKGMVTERMKILEKWERGRGHQWRGEVVERNAAREEVVVFACEVCGKVCKSKAGLVIHRRRMHEVSKKKKVFTCEGCQQEFGQEANLLNHKKGCGGPVSGSDRRRCVGGRDFAKSYIARHKKKCMAAVRASEEGERRPRVYKGERFVCACGKEMAKTNKARHEREACPQR